MPTYIPAPQEQDVPAAVVLVKLYRAQEAGGASPQQTTVAYPIIG